VNGIVGTLVVGFEFGSRARLVVIYKSRVN